MIHALVWKEYRTQRVAWVALALVGAATLFGLPVVMAPGGLASHPDVRMSLRFVAGALAWTYGLICGAMLLAGERETRTLTFLDMLPGFRRRVWLAKLLGGALLTAAQIVAIAGVAVAAGLFEDWTQAGWTFYGMVCGGLYGLAWGMLFSAFGSSVMNMILLALAAQLGAVFCNFFLSLVAVGFAATLFGVSTPDGQAAVQAAAGGLLAMLTVPAALAASALRFTRLDRGRLRPINAPAAARRAKPRVAWRVLFWLAVRQVRWFAAGMAVFALLLGFLTLADAIVLWPAFTLVIGVLCGATVFADEQQGPFRFLGDQRFPLTRLWATKVGLRLLIAAAAALITLMPSLFVAIVQTADLSESLSDRQFPFWAYVFHSDLLATVCPAGPFLVMWVLYGFAAGCLCGVLFRHGLAAGVFGLALGAATSVVWVPSLLQGGVHMWQVVGAPALLLLSTLPALRPWAAGRIVSWTTAKRLTPFALLALLWTAGGVWYRVLEIPDAPPKYDLAAFRASLPTHEENKAGDLILQACSDFANATRAPAEMAGQGGGAGMAGQAPAARKPSLLDRAEATLAHGWPADDHELAEWLDRVFAGEWVRKLNEAAAQSPGMLDDLHYLTIADEDRLGPSHDTIQRMAFVLVARGLQRQAAGDDGAFLDDMRLALTLARALRHRTPTILNIFGRNAEGLVLSGMDRWMEGLDGHPELLRQALNQYSDYLTAAAADEADLPKVNYLIAWNSLDEPLPWTRDYLNLTVQLRKADEAQRQQDAEWAALAGLLTPWEHERQQRILRLRSQGRGNRLPDELIDQSPVLMLDNHVLPLALPNADDWVCRERAMRLKLALRWYQAEVGRPAEALDALVPRYVWEVPDDPFDGRPFRYRLSRGENIEWPEDPPPPGEAAGPGAGGPPALPPQIGVVAQPPPAPPPQHTRWIPPGQGILWSVGPDRQDDGAKRQSRSHSGWDHTPGEDVIFLVPPPKAK